jgi:hypothetical protein
MANKTVQSVRGFVDILPEDVWKWRFIETTAREVFQLYGFEEIRTPLLEKTELFSRSVGEATDIVGKEMYTFTDRSGDSFTIPPCPPLHPRGAGNLEPDDYSAPCLLASRDCPWAGGDPRIAAPSDGCVARVWPEAVYRPDPCPAPGNDARVRANDRPYPCHTGRLEGAPIRGTRHTGKVRP